MQKFYDCVAFVLFMLALGFSGVSTAFFAVSMFLFHLSARVDGHYDI